MKRIGLGLAALIFAGCASPVAPTPQVVYVTQEPTIEPVEPVAVTDPTVEPEQPDEATPEPAEVPTDGVTPFGKTARVGDWDVRVTGKVNFDAWKAVKRENMFNDPAPSGWKMVIIPLAFTNRGDEKANLLGTGEYVYGQGTLVDRTDFDDPTCGVIPKPLDFFTDVRPGGTLKGNMCFVVENSDIKTLRFAVPDGLFSDTDIEFALQ